MQKIVIANWKMNPTGLREATSVFSFTSKIASSLKTKVVVCPPFVYLGVLKKNAKKVKLGAQDLSAENPSSGAFTGEVSGEMLYDVGVKYVILGHSERRALGEKNSDINKKIKIALNSRIIPILCVGELWRDSEHEYFNEVKEQILECLDGIQKSALPNIIIAYEPVWAISTTKERRDATPEDFLEMRIFIRKVLVDKFGRKIKMPKIIYGGSINDRNVSDFAKHEEVEGFLVGKASLNSKKFQKIIQICEASSN